MIPIAQVTDSRPPLWCGNEYASVDGFSPDDAYFLAIQVDHFQLFTAAGIFVKDLKIGASQQPRWISNTAVCFILGNQLLRMDVLTEKVAVIAQFGQYAKIDGKGEANFGDGAIALCGDDSSVFIFDLATGKSSRAYQHPLPFDSLYLSPDNNLLLSDNGGILMFTRDMVAERQLTSHNGHKDVCRDTDGKEVMVWTDNRDNAIYKVPLDGRPLTQIMKPLPWPVAVDISCPAQSGWAAVSTYSLSAQYPSQVLKAMLDGSGMEIICDTQSVMMVTPDGGMEYNPQPKTSISASGQLLIGCSNFGKVSDPNYCDVFMLRLDGAPRPVKRTRIDYSSFTGKSTFEMVPRADGAVDIYEVIK